MNMRIGLHVAAGLLLLSSWAAGCDSDEQGDASCSLTASIKFEGQEYIAAEFLPGLKRSEVRIGERLGTGELATCPGQPKRRVKVHRVVGVPTEQAVFSKSEHDLMKRLARGEAIE